MSRFNNPLDHVRIAAPCKSDWQQMIGTDRVRFCGQCNLNVYNLSSMTRVQAESLIAQTEGRLCVRFYRRTDGSILTRNCPVGLRVTHRRVSYLWKAVSAAVLGFFAGLGVYRTITPAPVVTRMAVMVETIGIALNNEQEPDTTPYLADEMGRVISLPVQNLAEGNGKRRIDKLRMGPTRENR
jgi:hypothetical protein